MHRAARRRKLKEPRNPLLFDEIADPETILKREKMGQEYCEEQIRMMQREQDIQQKLQLDHLSQSPTKGERLSPRPLSSSIKGSDTKKQFRASIQFTLESEEEISDEEPSPILEPGKKDYSTEFEKWIKEYHQSRASDDGPIQVTFKDFKILTIRMNGNPSELNLIEMHKKLSILTSDFKKEKNQI